MTNYLAPSGYVEYRLAVGSALFVGYLAHFTFIALGQWGKVNPLPLEPLQKRMHTFGIACLLSLSYIQASIFSTIFAWLTLACLLVLHLLSIDVHCLLIQENRNGFWITYYLIQGIWYFGIIIQFYQLT